MQFSHPVINAVSEHALQRWRERTLLEFGREKDFTELATAITRAHKEVFLRKKFRIHALLNHGIQDARYFRSGPWTLVVVNGVLRTVHNGEANRWEGKVDE
jgi:hypothetical protein